MTNAEQPRELACRELVELVTDFLEGALPEEERRAFAAHLEACPFCTEFVEQVRATAGALRGLGEPELAPERQARLLDAFRGWRDS